MSWEERQARRLQQAHRRHQTRRQSGGDGLSRLSCGIDDMAPADAETLRFYRDKFLAHVPSRPFDDGFTRMIAGDGDKPDKATIIAELVETFDGVNATEIAAAILTVIYDGGPVG